MTNAEKLVKDLLENLDDFVKIIYNGMCPMYKCYKCPLFNTYHCKDPESIKKWLESEAEEDAEVH